MKSLRQSVKVVPHVLLFMFLFFYSRSYTATYIDDAFIQFQYSKILATSGTWGFFDGIRTNTATSPLNVLLLSLITLFSQSAVKAAVSLTALEFYFLCIFLCLISKHLFGLIRFGVFAFIAFITNPLFLSTLGMESWLFVVILVFATYLFIRGKWHILPVTLALLTLARPDGFLMLLLILIMAPASRRIPIAFLYVLILTPWYLFSWIHLGSFFPDTLIIKMVQKNWEGKSFSDGLSYFYLSKFPVATIVSFLLLPFGLFSLYSRNRDTQRFIQLIGCFVLLQFAAYTLLRVPPYHWYYVPLCAGSILLGSIGVASAIDRFSKRNSWPPFACGVLIPVLGFLAVVNNSGYPFTEAPIHTNWATHRQYKTAGLWLKENTDPTSEYIMMGEIGTLAYYSDRRLINNFSSVNSTLYLINKTRHARKGITNTFLDWNFHWRQMGSPGTIPPFTLVHLFRKEDRNPASGELMRWDTSTSWVPQGTLILRRSTIQTVK